MSIIKRRRNGTVQVILQLTGKQFYLGTEDKINPDRIYEALSYLWDKITTRHERDLEYYEKVGQKLENLLPEEDRRRLLAKEEKSIEEALKTISRLFSEKLTTKEERKIIEALNIMEEELRRPKVFV